MWSVLLNGIQKLPVVGELGNVWVDVDLSGALLCPILSAHGLHCLCLSKGSSLQWFFPLECLMVNLFLAPTGCFGWSDYVIILVIPG